MSNLTDNQHIYHNAESHFLFLLQLSNCNPLLTAITVWCCLRPPEPGTDSWSHVSGASKRRCPESRAHMRRLLSSLVMIMCNVYTGPDTRHKVPNTGNKSRGAITMDCNGKCLTISLKKGGRWEYYVWFTGRNVATGWILIYYFWVSGNSDGLSVLKRKKIKKYSPESNYICLSF